MTIALEVLLGVSFGVMGGLLGALVGFGGFLILEGVTGASRMEEAMGPLLLFTGSVAIIGTTIGIGLGVTYAGALGGKRGSFWVTLAGGVLGMGLGIAGSIVSIHLAERVRNATDASDLHWYIVFIATPLCSLVLAILAFHLVRREIPVPREVEGH